MATRYFIVTIFTLLGLVCVAQPETKMTVDEYIQMYKFAAISEMHEHGVPASITLSQGLIESANGNSRLAREGNNHFGIKCKSDWIGEKIYEDDDAEHECFRAYPSVWDSYKDHSLFLKNGQRYAFLFELDITDYKGWAKGLKKAGYATNPRYADILIGVIERNKLFEYDKVTPEQLKKLMGADTVKTIVEVAPPKVEKQTIVYNNIPAVKVDGTQSVDEIAVENELRPKWVKRWNDIEEGQALKPGDMVYLKPKKRKGTERYHTVQEGEDMWEISQTYAIKLKHLYKKNHMERGTQPAVGEKIYLQEKSETTPDTTKPKVQVVKKEEPKKETIKPITPPIKKEVKEAPKPIEKTEEKKEETITHIVKTGETLYGIAKMYSITVDELKKLNNLTENTLSVGQKLIIKQAATKTAVKYHIVEAGETLYSISKKYGITVEQLKEWNNFTTDLLSTGQKIIVSK